MEHTPSICVVDDEEGIRRSVERALSGQGYGVRVFETGRALLDAHRQDRADLFILDLRLPDMDGIQLMKAIQALGGPAEFIIITGQGTVETAVEAMKLGAYDYIEKPFERAALLKVVRKALEKHRLVRENQELRHLLATGREDAFAGHNPRLRIIMELVHQVAPTSATVLIQGESGTGKEVLADTIHRLSPRRDRPFVKINCAALPETLLESELFGHERGAFTDAAETRPGKFEQAAGGTLFLDEVGDMSPAMQVKLLRVLQEREFQRVGGTRTLTVDVRILAATNTDLETAVQQGRFRQDLFFRLNVINIHLPPLRERRDDIPLLAYHFLRRYARRNGKILEGFDPEVLALFQRHDWPGNIRELQNVVERGVILSRGPLVSAEDLPERLLGPRAVDAASAGATADRGEIMVPFGTPLAEVERRYVEETVRRLSGNKNLAADLLGVNLRTIYRRLDSGGTPPAGSENV
jgi:two-component system response regulator HydG